MLQKVKNFVKGRRGVSKAVWLLATVAGAAVVVGLYTYMGGQIQARGGEASTKLQQKIAGI